MIATARGLRRIYGNDLRMVFIGPCIAKKGEAISACMFGEIDAVLTPEQKKKNDEMIRRFEEWRKKEAERNPSHDRREQDPPPPARDR